MGDNENYDDEMSETTVEEKGALSQIGSSFKNMLAGFICFIVAWPVLFYGATRVEWAKVFKEAVPVEQAKEGKPSYVTGIANADMIGDNNLAKGKYLRIYKTPEVYAYVEHTKSTTKERKKGITKTTKETTTTTEYSYTKEWTSNPKPVSSFNQKFWNKYADKYRVNQNITNPTLDEKGTTINAANCKVNGYSVDVASVDFKGSTTSLKSIYVKGTEGNPRIGDKRINYSVYHSGIQYTFAGSASGKKMLPYETKDTSMLAGAPGDFKTLMAALKQSDKMAGMLWFFGGFILMALGLTMLAGPVTTLLDFIPFVGGLGSGLIKVVLVIVALVLSALFYWLIKLWWLWLIVVACAVGFLIFKKKAGKTATASA